MTVHDLFPFLSSIAIGMLIGLERERSHPADVHQSAGPRTFALLALSGTLAATIDPWVVVAGLCAAAALLVIGYLGTSRRDPGATTEVAALSTFLLGALAWHQTAVAAALGITVLVLLMSKTRIHSFARDVVTDREVDDAVKFLVMAFVVLPLLPNRDVGPYGAFNPERIWQLVLALSGISWVGYLATRALGPRRGPLIAGLAGGFISASATTASMGRLSRTDSQLRPAVAGAYIASIATFVQLAFIVTVGDRTLMPRLWPALVVGALVLAGVAGAMTIRPAKLDSNEAANVSAPPDDAAPRPFALKPALVLAGVLTIALLLGRWIVDVAGPRATLLATGAAGLADAHAGALTAATLHRQDQISTSIALLGVAVAVTANSGVKCILAFVAGGRRFGWRVAAGLVPASAAFLVATMVAA
ncbi:MAG: DUF4010 domain-containing protein [Actinomycetia bacterium]|nr:DUF4010 domain-containing protein [Actinomycetes bacterium]